MSEQERAFTSTRRVSRAERFAIVLAALVLAALAFLFVLLTIDLVAAASGSSYSVWEHVGLPAHSGDRTALLFAGAVVGVLLVIAGLRLRDPMLRITMPNGCVILRSAAVEESLVRSMSRDPDILRTRVCMRVRRGQLRTRADVLLRPLSDAQRLRSKAGVRMHAALCEAIGMECPPLRIRVRVVPVRKLARYL